MKEAYFLTYLLLCLGLGSAKAQFNIPEKDKCKVKASATASQDSICQGYSDTLNASVSGGAIPYTYSWIPDTGLSCNTCPNPIATPNNTTTYTVTVTDNNGCSATAKVKVKVNKPPVFNANANLALLLLGDSMHATGGDPPYTYNWAPPISSSLLLSLPTSPTNYTLTVTGANGCSSTDIATYIPAPNKTAACGSIFIDQYIQDTLNHDDAIELYNPTPSNISLDDYYLFGTTNGSLYAPPFIIRLHGTIKAYKTFLVANTHADSALTHKAKMLSDSLNFGGSDIVALATMTVVASHVAVQALDAVGAVSPLPTDSGWAVSTGSTKNHTLIRQAIVTQGDISWPSCQLQWTVFPQGTFSKIGNYHNICAPTDPDIILYLVPLPIQCGDPSYSTFAVLAASNPPTIFNNCILDISYGGGLYTGDSVSNGGISITQGSQFQPGVGNDYDSLNVINLSDTVMKITFGSVSDSSPNGTLLPNPSFSPNPDTLFLVTLKVQNSCEEGVINFINTVYTDTAYYGAITRTFYLDSTFVKDSLCCPHICTDSCDYDFSCDCYLDTCAITCDDTIPIYRNDTTFTGSTYSNKHYTNIDYVADGASIYYSCGVSVDRPDPINAGTNAMSVPPNSSILTLTGYGFGSTKGTIQVQDANGGINLITLDDMDILSWTENKIVVRMPSFMLSDTNHLYPEVTPGSTPYANLNCNCHSTYFNLQINYNIENEALYNATIFVKARPNIIMSTPNASMVFRCDTSITNNPQAFACVKKAVREWNCYTGVNWTVGDTIILDTTRADGISNIYFSNYNFPTPSTLMKTTPEYGSCYNQHDSVTFYNEADIMIKRNGYLSKPWNYDTTYTIIAPGYYYFYDAILHELGHAHGLGHINDQFSLMYHTILPGHRDSIPGGSTYPGPATLYGAFDMINTSTSYTPGSLGCNQDTMLVPNDRKCKDPTMDVPDIPKNAYNLNLYPNPVNNGDITILYQLSTNSYVQFKIIDCMGREVLILNEEHKLSGTHSEQINTDSFARGVYLFVANINGTFQTIKFIKL